MQNQKFSRSILFIALLGLFNFTSEAKSGQVADRVELLKSKGVRFSPLQLLKAVQPSATTNAIWQKELKAANVLQLDMDASRALLEAPAYAFMELPYNGGKLVLELVQTQITTDDFKVNTSSGQDANYIQGVHYRGMVRGVAGSLAAISIYDDQVMGLIQTPTEQFVLGRFENDRSGLHVLYNTDELLGTNSYTCGTADATDPYREEDLTINSGERTTRCVRYYWEVNYDIFQGKGQCRQCHDLCDRALQPDLRSCMITMASMSRCPKCSFGTHPVLTPVLQQAHSWTLSEPLVLHSTGTWRTCSAIQEGVVLLTAEPYATVNHGTAWRTATSTPPSAMCQPIVGVLKW
jgi:hypothetical protein